MGAPQPPKVTITKLVDVNIRQAWPKEAGDFTPWLLANASELSAVLGAEVELDDKEHKVGSFSLDLIGRVAGGDGIVIVENQYGPTDHDHLGKLLTYAGGTEPAIVIWIAEEFREEHRAALDWLNESTLPSIRFFGIELSVVRLASGDANLVAPLLTLVCQPNDWGKLAKASVSGGSGPQTTSPTTALYKQFWERFAVIAKQKGWTTGTPPAASWWTLPAGSSSVWWTVSYTNFGCRSELYFGHTDPAVNLWRLQQMVAKQEQLQAAYGPDELHFDPLPSAKACRIEARWEGPKIAEEASWDSVIEWMVDTQERLRAAVITVGGIPTSVPPTPLAE